MPDTRPLSTAGEADFRRKYEALRRKGYSDAEASAKARAYARQGDLARRGAHRAHETVSAYIAKHRLLDPDRWRERLRRE